VSAAGVGQWKPIPPTPVSMDGGSCTISNSTIYCVGGSPSSITIASAESGAFSINSSFNSTSFLSDMQNESSVAFFAPIGAGGSVGNWISTSPYPTQLRDTECASNGSYIYCVGGSAENASQQVFFSGLDPAIGIEGWLPTSDYPIPFYSGYCSTNARS
jgi:hypothetical protein